MMWVAIVTAVAAASIGGWWWLRRRKRQRTRLISFVGLLREPRSFDPAILRTQIQKAWNIDVGIGETESADGHLIAVGPFVHVFTEDGMYLLNSFDEPYVKDVEKAAESIADLRLQQPFEQHVAWFSVDAFGIDGTTDEETISKAYQKLGKLFAEMIDDDCLLIVLPDENRLFPLTDATHDALLSDDPRAALQDTLTVPIVMLDGDDPKMKAAVAEARRRWPEFVDHFERQDGESFSVKAPVTVGETTEFIWILVTSMEGERIYGTLGNEPHDLGHLKEGSKVSVFADDLNDWIFIKNEAMKGGFTIPLMNKSLKGK